MDRQAVVVAVLLSCAVKRFCACRFRCSQPPSFEMFKLTSVYEAERYGKTDLKLPHLPFFYPLKRCFSARRASKVDALLQGTVRALIRSFPAQAGHYCTVRLGSFVSNEVWNFLAFW